MVECANCEKITLTEQEIAHIKERLQRGDKSLEVLPQLLAEVKKLGHEVSTIRPMLLETKELVSAWGNIKGFGKTMRAISAFLKIAAILAASIGTLFTIFYHPSEAIRQILDGIRGK